MTRREIVEALAGVPVLAALEPSELEQLADRAVPRRFHKGEQIFSQGEPGKELYLVVSGTVQITKESAIGREITLALRERGACVGDMALIDGQPRSASGYALGDCTCLVLGREEFQHFLADNPEACQRLLVLLSARLREAAQRVEDLAVRTVRQRLASVLASFALKEGEPDGQAILLPSTVNYKMLTGLMCTTRESVSRAAAELIDDGLLDRKGRRFKILDLDGLHKVANEQ